VTYLFPLHGCEPHLAEVVGGKAVGLGSLLREQLNVPNGFAISTHAYREFVGGGLETRLRDLLTDVDSLQGEAEASVRIRALFDEGEIQPSLLDELRDAYAGLGEPPVAVRSSAISEDAAEASFAGEHETYLWLQGVDSVAQAVVACWASLFTSRALAYFRRVGVRADETAMGVVVQTMVPAQSAGVMLTLDPATGDRSQITIESSFGLGEAVVSGEVTPDRFAIDKVTLEIRSRTIAVKALEYRVDHELGSVRVFDVPYDEQELPSLTDEQAVAVAALGKRVERALGSPQDIEWAIGPDSEVSLLQTRPETVWSRQTQIDGVLGPWASR
jgi:pyruvate,water dikinase